MEMSNIHMRMLESPSCFISERLIKRIGETLSIPALTVRKNFDHTLVEASEDHISLTNPVNAVIKMGTSIQRPSVF